MKAEPSHNERAVSLQVTTSLTSFDGSQLVCSHGDDDDSQFIVGLFMAPGKGYWASDSNDRIALGFSRFEKFLFFVDTNLLRMKVLLFRYREFMMFQIPSVP